MGIAKGRGTLHIDNDVVAPNEELYFCQRKLPTKMYSRQFTCHVLAVFIPFFASHSKRLLGKVCLEPEMSYYFLHVYVFRSGGKDALEKSYLKKISPVFL